MGNSQNDSYLVPHRSTNSAFKNPISALLNGYSWRLSCPPPWYYYNICLHAVDDIWCKPFIVDTISQHKDSPCPHSVDRCKPFVADTIGQHKDSPCPHSLDQCKPFVVDTIDQHKDSLCPSSLKSP